MRIFFFLGKCVCFVICSYRGLSFFDPSLNIASVPFFERSYLFAKPCVFALWERIGDVLVFMSEFDKRLFRYDFVSLECW